MATRYYCDKCDNWFENKENTSKVEFSETTPYTKVLSQCKTISRDLCINCIRELNDWMKLKPVKDMK